MENENVFLEKRIKTIEWYLRGMIHIEPVTRALEIQFDDDSEIQIDLSELLTLALNDRVNDYNKQQLRLFL